MKNEERFIETKRIEVEGSSHWEAPSNIALVKYWGKYGAQYPQNPSLSFTLSKCVTQTLISFKPKPSLNNNFSFSFKFEGKTTPSFYPKIETFLKRIDPYVPFVKNHHLDIESSNSFPHSSGIASSASGMAALALAIMDIERMGNPNMSESYFLQKSSFLARLGSGSAARSIEGPLVVWGACKNFKNSSNLYGVKIEAKVNSIFEEYQDTILLIDKGQKKVSSTLGHDLMNNHPYAPIRFKQAYENVSKLSSFLETGDIEAFIYLVESEALTLHALMMASNPYFVLMQPNTLEVLQKVWNFRTETKVPLCFTLDAGANVHLLYPKSEKEVVLKFIQEELIVYCQGKQYIEDQVGIGSKKITF